MNLKVPTSDAKKWCWSRNNIPYFETSAKDGSGVVEAFQGIARDAVFKEKAREATQLAIVIPNIKLATITCTTTKGKRKVCNCG